MNDLKLAPTNAKWSSTEGKLALKSKMEVIPSHNLYNPMKKICLFGMLFMLLFHPTINAQPSKTVQGIWQSYGRPDTIKLFFADTLAYFMSPSIPTLNQIPFSFFIYNLNGQLMVQFLTADQKSEARFRLWIVTPDEIKLQSVDPTDINNPLKHIPKQTDSNTFRLKKMASLMQ